MPPSNQDYRDTIEALKAIIDESLKHPEKRKEFVDEGSIELIIGLCDVKSIPWSLGAYCAAALRILAHGNAKVKAKIVGRGGISPLLKLCDPEAVSDDAATSEDAYWRLLAHEQAAAVLQIISFQNPSCQAEMVTAGAIKHLVRLCDVLNPEGCHTNCCQSTSEHSSDASKLLQDLTYKKKLVGKVKEMTLEDIRENAVKLVRTGLVSGLTQVHRLYSVDLYDTTVEYQDVRISDELIKSQLMWPDIAVNQTDSSSEDKEKYVNPKDRDFRWVDVYVTEVIDACHFWAHVGGKLVIERMEAINKELLSQEQIPLNSIPEPGTFVCVSEMIGGHKDSYRAQVLSADPGSDGSLTVKVFAIDNGFTKSVSATCLYVLPEHLLGIPTQATLCCLSGVQAPPKSAEILEHAAGALRNLTEESNSYRVYVAAQQGLDFLIKLSTIPNRDVCKEAVGALLNLALNSKARVRIGFLGGIQVLLDVCQRFPRDEEMLLLAIGGIQNLVQDSYVNRCRLADSDGLIILTEVYFTSESDAVKTRCLHAVKNLLGNSITSLENGALEINTRTPAHSSFDTRSIVDGKKKFSLAVSDDDPPCERGRRRRRRRLRRGEVEPKPTPVALSADSIKRSSTGESDGYSDYENSASYEDTDGDTDGERLVTNKQVPTSIDNKDVDKERYYIQGYHVPFSEDDLHDFRPQANINSVSTRPIARSLCAYLNSGKCGTVYLGIRRDGVVAGLRIDRHQRDQLRLGVDDVMDRFNPPVKHHSYEVDFVPVVRRQGSDSPSSRIQVEDRFVVEIKIVNCPGLTYTTSGKCYFRQKSRNEEYTTQEVREKTIKEQENLYNSEMQSLRMELEEMKKQLHEKSSRVVDKSPHIFTQQDSHPTSIDKEKTAMNGDHGSRIPGTAMDSTNSLVEPQLDDLQAANCVIS
ncbi:uncharacterized protein LOC144664652 isoform X2 [Oculina patagonica]